MLQIHVRTSDPSLTLFQNPACSGKMQLQGGRGKFWSAVRAFGSCFDSPNINSKWMLLYCLNDFFFRKWNLPIICPSQSTFFNVLHAFSIYCKYNIIKFHKNTRNNACLIAYKKKKILYDKFTSAKKPQKLS